MARRAFSSHWDKVFGKKKKEVDKKPWDDDFQNDVQDPEPQVEPESTRPHTSDLKSEVRSKPDGGGGRDPGKEPLGFNGQLLLKDKL